MRSCFLDIGNVMPVTGRIELLNAKEERYTNIRAEVMAPSPLKARLLLGAIHPLRVWLNDKLAQLAHLAGWMMRILVESGIYERKSSLQNAIGTQAVGQVDSQCVQDAFLVGVGAGDAAEDQSAAVGGLQFNVADQDLTERAQDHFRRYRPWPRCGLTASRVGLADLGH